MPENNSSNPPQQPQQGGAKEETEEQTGRVQRSQNPAFENEQTQADISNVDQQEGTMNNGTVGGDLKQDA